VRSDLVTQVAERADRRIITQGLEVKEQLVRIQTALAGSIEELDRQPNNISTPALQETFRMMREAIADADGRAWWSNGVGQIKRQLAVL